MKDLVVVARRHVGLLSAEEGEARMSKIIGLRSNAQNLCLMAAVMMCCGCNSKSEKGGTDTVSKQDQENGGKTTEEKRAATADAILDRTIRAYQTAKSYSDSAKLRVVQKQAGGEDELIVDFAVAFERPNRLRCKLDTSLLLSNGEELYATAPDWSGQVVVTAAPEKIQVPAFYNDEKLQQFFQQIMYYPIQLDLLTADEPLQEVRNSDQEPVLLEQRPWQDSQCDRIGFNMREGEFVLWIDRETHLLRRVDYPAGAVYVVTMELNDAALNTGLTEEEFKWPSSDDEMFVHALVPPPNPQFQPNPLLGRQVESFSLVGADGKKIGPDSLKGKITAIDVWATWCGPCKIAMPKFDQVARKYTDAEDVQFLAVSIDDQSVDNATIAKQLEEMGFQIPTARLDFENNPNLLEQFGVGMIPLYVILGKDGRLQMLHLGGDITTEMLSSYIDRLREGEDTHQRSAEDANKRWQQMLREFEQQVQAVRVDGGLTKTFELPATQIAELSVPEKFKLTELWQVGDINAPGNLLVAEGQDAPRIFVIDAARQIIELDMQGKIVSTLDNLISERQFITFVRAATTKDGAAIYLAGASDQPQIFVFDADWKQLLSYPEDNTAQIADATIADLDGDQTPEIIVGYRGEVGVHGVTLEGRRKWRNRSIGQLFGLTVTMANAEGHRRTVCTHALGTLVPIDHEGREWSPIRAANRSIMHASVTDLDGDGDDDLCALTLDLANEWSAMGLTANGTILWQQPLPGGFYETPIEPIASAKIDEAAADYWIVAAPDSSIHIISEDGRIVDQFSNGKKLFGLATTKHDGHAVIIATSEKNVTAWTIETK